MSSAQIGFKGMTSQEEENPTVTSHLQCERRPALILPSWFFSFFLPVLSLLPSYLSKSHASSVFIIQWAVRTPKEVIFQAAPITLPAARTISFPFSRIYSYTSSLNPEVVHASTPLATISDERPSARFESHVVSKLSDEWSSVIAGHWPKENRTSLSPSSLSHTNTHNH